MTHRPNQPARRPLARIEAFTRTIVVTVVAFWRARAHRRDVANLLTLDDRMLKDVGLMRGDILGALAEPAGADPSIDLRLRSVENRLRQRDRAAKAVRTVRREGARTRLTDTKLQARA